jgi:hypothetical protein
MSKNISVLVLSNFKTSKRFKVFYVSLKLYIFMKYMANNSMCIYVSASAGKFKNIFITLYPQEYRFYYFRQ